MRVHGLALERRHGAFEHVALIHDGPDDLHEQVASRLAAAVARDEPVLVCLDEDAWHGVISRVGDVGDRATFVPAEVRNRRPTAAVHAVHDFAQRALASGADKVWAIGSIDYGRDRHGRWLRYEAAVNDVLGHLPLGAVCTFDRRTLARAESSAAHACHGPGDHAVVETPDWIDTGTLPPALVDVTAMTPSFRHDLALALAGDTAAAPLLDDVQLVGTELLTNAHRHGEPPIRVRCWRREHDIVLEATDHGAGLTDPYPDLRPPQPGLTGYGLWLIGQIVDDFSVRRTPDGRTIVTVGIAVTG